MSQSSVAGVDGRLSGPLGLLAYAVVLWTIASGHLAWLLWRFVPMHEAMLAGMGAPLSSGARLAIAAGHWWVRVMPLLTTASLFLGAGVIAVLVLLVALGKLTARAVTRGLAAFFLAAGLCVVVASAAIVQSIQAVYQDVAMDPRFEQRR